MQLIGKLQLGIIFNTSRWGIAVIFFVFFLRKVGWWAFNGLCGVKAVEVPCMFYFLTLRSKVLIFMNMSRTVKFIIFNGP